MKRRAASLVPFGLGSKKPRHFLEMVRILWENRDSLPYAWRLLRDGTCDGCALGTKGLEDWTLDGTHLCMVRLELLRLNTLPAADPERLRDVASLLALEPAALRALGRLPAPMVRRSGDRGFTMLGWDEALDLAADGLRKTDPERAALYLTSRGIPNETYYVAQKAWRFYGSPHVDNSARLCHAGSTSAMKRAFGHGAATCSYTDWIDADLLVFFGANPANNQPVATKYLYAAKKRGAEIAIVNPYREPGMDRYWIPSIPESALFGTSFTDHWFAVHTGGDLAFVNGVIKALLARPDGVDRDFVASSTAGYRELVASIEAQSWERLVEASGSPRERMEDLARLLVERPKAVLVWSMGLTQHVHGADTVGAVCNLGLLRGLLGREGSGLVPIRGHSGVQGGAEVGAVPVDDGPVLDRWSKVWGFEPPRTPGRSTLAQLDAAAHGELDVFWLIGGNFLGTVAGEDRSRRALFRPRLRVHQDIVLNRSMLVDPSDTVLLLPATTRYEMPGGCTETSTERRIIYSPEVEGQRIADARPEWQVLADVMQRVWPEHAEQIHFEGTAEIRAEIAQAVPLYEGIEALAEKGDSFQWGGPRLFADGRFATPDSRGHFVPVEPPDAQRESGTFRVSTRRGKQFNSIVQREHDNLNGAPRDAVLMSRADADGLGVSDGDAVRLRSPNGRYDAKVHIAPMLDGNLEVYWPEGNVLLSPEAVDPVSNEPDYNADVSVLPLALRDAG